MLGENSIRKLETLANVAIIVVAILLSFVIAKKYLFSQNEDKQKPSISIGMKLELPEIDWKQSPKTLLFVLQKECRYCSESASFYKKIVANKSNANNRLIAILPSNLDESSQYLETLGLKVDEIKQQQLSKINISGTPTLILVNNSGEITDFWIGKLNQEKEIEVLSKIN